LTKSGWAIWITGLPASGKSTVVNALKEGLDGMGVNAQILESDTVRRVLVPDPTHSPEEREAFYNSLVYIGVLLTKNGVNVIFDATANKRRWRRAARGLIEDFLQVTSSVPSRSAGGGTKGACTGTKSAPLHLSKAPMRPTRSRGTRTSYSTASVTHHGFQRKRSSRR